MKKNMSVEISTLCDLFSLSRSGIFKWKKEDRAIIELVEKYFTEDEIQEFLKTRKISSKEETLNIDIKTYIDEQIDKRLQEKIGTNQ